MCTKGEKVIFENVKTKGSLVLSITKTYYKTFAVKIMHAWCKGQQTDFYIGDKITYREKYNT